MNYSGPNTSQSTSQNMGQNHMENQPQPQSQPQNKNKKGFKRRFHDFFVPHDGNNHNPHFWRDRSIGLLLAIILVAELAVFTQSFIFLKKDSFLAAVLPAVLTSLTNDKRAENKVALVTENSLLVEAARMKAEDMAKRGYFSHNTPEGKLPWYWLEQVGYQYDEAGENLAVNFYDSKDVVDAWMNSPTHRENIVKGSYTEMGIAMANGIYEGRPAIYVAQFFGRPKKVATASVAYSNVSFSNISASASSTASAKTSTSTKVATASTTTVATSSVKATTSAQVAGAEIQSEPQNESDSIAQAATKTENPNIMESFAASPRHAGKYILIVLLSVILAAFLILIFITRHINHPRIWIAMIALVLIIVALLIINSEILDKTVVLGSF